MQHKKTQDEEGRLVFSLSPQDLQHLTIVALQHLSNLLIIFQLLEWSSGARVW